MVLTLSIIILLLLLVIYYLYNQNTVLRKKQSDGIVEILPEDTKVSNETYEVESTDDIEDHREIQTEKDISINTKVSKSEAIGIVNSFLGRPSLSNANTNFSNINKTIPVWWFDIPPSRFSKDLNLILAKQKGFIWIKLPKGMASDPSKVFYIRKDNGLVQIVISSERGNNYLRDNIGSHFNFGRYVVKEF